MSTIRSRAPRPRLHAIPSARPLLVPLALLAATSACGGGAGGSGGSSGAMILLEAGNGFGQLLPHRAQELGPDGAPQGTLIDLRTLDDLIQNVTPSNPVLAPTPWPASATLPGGTPGNHFLFARTKQPIDPASVFGLGGAVLAQAITPDGGTVALQGRMFVGGATTATPGSSGGALLLEQWVQSKASGLVALTDVDGDGEDEYATAPGLGFPGTQGDFAGAAALADPRTLVFVADTDDDLATHETFPSGVQVHLRLTTSVRAVSGAALEEPALASATVGPDDVRPEVVATGGFPAIVPGNGDVDVDPATSVTIRFTEPVQPHSVGPLPDGGPPALAASIALQFGPTTKLTKAPFHAAPLSVFDLAHFELTPAYAFPGSGPADASCGLFSRVDVLVTSEIIADLADNRNGGSPATWFTTGAGAGLVNAPIAPEAIYVGRGGATASLSVVDTNGFGFGTGAPGFDPTCKWQEGTSNSANDPNVLLHGSKLIPALAPGSCTFDGGSAGPFTLVRDSNLDDRLVQGETLISIADMALGHSLDELFNNAAPFGCQSGGGNVCASASYKQAVFTISSTQTLSLAGFGNLLQFAPHPNPPPLVYPPICTDPFLGAQEPTSVDTTSVYGVTNLLQTGGQPFGNPATCAPPDGLYSPTTHVFINWGGPSADSSAGNCTIYTVRQQVGHFLYVADRAANEVVVLNSNRMIVLDRIPLTDPTAFAMSPNLDLLAVASHGSNAVRFIDVNPGSSQFHSVVKTVTVGQGPTAIAWEPGNEDILVCNTGSNSVSVISAAGLTVRKTLTNQLSGPIGIAVTPRQLGFGMQRYVYFAYVLNADGRVSVFESGPDGVNGWGYDAIIGVLPFTFREPKAIQPDPVNLNSGFWVAHQDQLAADGTPTGLKGGAITNVAIVGGVLGVVPLELPFVDPAIRDLQWGVRGSIGSDQLTGVPTDIAFDDWTNSTTFPNYTTPFSHGPAQTVNAKGLVHQNPGGGINLANAPVTLYAAVPNSIEGPGVVDVIDLGAGLQRIDVNPFQPGVQSIPAPGAQVLMHYFRQ